MKNIVFFVLAAIIAQGCKNDKGIDPDLAFTDRALLDSCRNQPAFSYYKSNADTVYSGATGPHGNFKLRFNKIAANVLTDNGKLPAGSKFPEGSFIVKDVIKNGSVYVYAFMYKRKGNWIWGEAETNGNVHHSAAVGNKVCVNCHSQAGNRDLTVTFKYY